MPHPDFNPPGKFVKLTGRTSTLTGLFVVTLTPYIPPTAHEVDEALSILGMTRGHCVCAYCGGVKTEWDHFRPTVSGKAPTGFITEIANLVPSCGRCNQSKSGAYWREWINGGAKKSPRTLKVPGLDEKVARLDEFEVWRKPTKVNYEKLVEADVWAKHWKYHADILRMLSRAESHAQDLRKNIEKKVKGRRRAG
jgi:hypothetical protein